VYATAAQVEILETAYRLAVRARRDVARPKAAAGLFSVATPHCQHALTPPACRARQETHGVLRKTDLYQAQIGGAAPGDAAGSHAQGGAAAGASPPAEQSRYGVIWRCSTCAPSARPVPSARRLVRACCSRARAAAPAQAELSQERRQPAVLAAQRAAL
jgi:hypothetical protein